jgi:SagB-type dehydrogenase family enzyme
MLNPSRHFLKSNLLRAMDFSKTDQNRKVAAPPLEKPCSDGTGRIDLIKPGEWPNLKETAIEQAIERRRSRRKYTSIPISLKELSFLLWATQGVRSKPIGTHVFRTVPSAGCRHALETYVAAFKVTGLASALYRYLPMTHQLVLVSPGDGLEYRVREAASDQTFAGEGALTLIWTAIPYRMEWRYGLASYKLIALDAGHVCQSLYLACEAIGAGTCAIAAYDQEKADLLVDVDGDDEFVIYMAPVGKI